MAEELFESTAEVEVTESENIFDGWDDDSTDDGWDDDEVTETEATGDTAEEAEADQAEADTETETQTEESAEQPTEEVPTAETEAPAEEPKEEKPQTYKLQHMDDPIMEVTAEQMIPLAQKGLDYDRIRTERDAMREKWAGLVELEKFAQEMLSNSNGYNSIEELIDDARAEWLIRSEANYGRPLTKDNALARVKTLREESVKSNTPKAEPKVPTEKEQADSRDKAIEQFCMEYPQVDAKTIPQSVWADFRKDGNLVKAYAKYEASQRDAEILTLKKEIETLKQNNKNRERSTGSMKTTGQGKKPDPMFEGWDD